MVQFTSSTVSMIMTLSSLAFQQSAMAQDLPTFAEILANDTNLSLLSGAITTAGLNITVDEPITIFAPTNAAFEKVDSKTLSQLLLPGWGEHLQNLLAMHIVNSETFSDAIMDGDVLIAANEEEISVEVIGDNVTLSSPNTNNSVITAVDIGSSDGVVHQIDTVLLPQFVSVDLLSLAGNVDGFSILTELLKLTGLEMFVTPNVVATVFAPTDAAFMALGDDALEFYRSDTAATTTLLTAHVLTPLILPTQDMVTGILGNKTAGGTELYINVEETSDGTVYMVNNATISDSVLANNGIIHAISAVFSVPGTEVPGPTPPTTPTAPMPSPPTTPTPPNPAPTSDASLYGFTVVTVMSSFFVWFTIA